MLGLSAERRNRARHAGALAIAGGVALQLGVGFGPEAFAQEGLIYNSSGTCTRGGEPNFPAQGVLRARDDGIVEVAT